MVLLALLACNGSDAGVKVYNSSPSVAIQNPVTGASFNEGEAVTFTGKVSDDQTPAETLQVQWTSDVDGVIDQGPAGSDGVATFATVNLTPAAHVITLYAVDEGALQGQATVTITIVDLPEAPTISIARPLSGDLGAEGEQFEFKAQVSDAQDAYEDLSVSFASDVDGTFCTPTVDATGIAQCAYALSGGDHYLTYTVTDTSGESGTATAFFQVTALADQDGDGDGYTPAQGDCDDTTSAIKPGAPEVEDGVDDDCDGLIDEGTDAFDDDGDGYSEEDGDCDDGDDLVNPDAIEDCFTDADDNCDGTTSEEDALNCDLYYYDSDGDGFGSDSVDGACYCAPQGKYTAANNNDCYDYNASANPGASTYQTSSRGDGSYDWNCDGVEQKYYSTAGSECDFDLDFADFCSYGEGWDGGVAACGVSANYIIGCEGGFFTCDDTLESRQQACL